MDGDDLNNGFSSEVQEDSNPAFSPASFSAASLDSPAPKDLTIDDLIDSVKLEGSQERREITSPEESPNIKFLLNVPLPVTFEVGRAKMTIGDLLSLGQGSVVELHRLVGETLDIFVNGKLVAKGEVVVVNEKFGARIMDVVPPEKRIHYMKDLER